MADHPAHRRHYNHNKRFSASRPHSQPRKRRRTPASHSPSHGHHHQQAAPQVPVCCICANSNSKPPSYKCPKCRALYCSVACCKEHKNVCPGKPPEESTIVVKPSSSHPPLQAMSGSRPKPRRQYNGDDDDDNVLDDGWKVTDEMKKALENSQWLRNQLKDGGLREVIRQVVASGEVLEQQQAQQHRFPQFQVFRDKLLVVAGVLEREGDTTDEPLEEWLEQDWGHDPPPLSLKPWRRQVPRTFPPVDVSSSDVDDDDDDDDENSDDSSEDKDEANEESSASAALSSPADAHQSDEGEEQE